MVCGRRTGLWLDERRLVIACCWKPIGHPWECHDPTHTLRWTPGQGTDSTGMRYLIDPADMPLEDLEEAARDARPCGQGLSAA